MTRHLTDEHVIAAAEDELSPADARHLAECAACATRVRTLRQTLRQIGEVDVPEPSPAFWPHFTANVTAAIRESPPPRNAWLTPWILGWSTAAAILALSLLGVQMTRSNDDVPQPLPGTLGASREASTESDDIDTDEAWAIVRSLAGDLHYDQAHEAGVAPRPGSVEHAATELSEDERAELIRLIEDDIRRTKA